MFKILKKKKMYTFLGSQRSHRVQCWDYYLTELYSFYRCMLDKNLFKETRPVQPDIINVVIDLRAVLRNVFNIRGKHSYPNFSLI